MLLKSLLSTLFLLSYLLPFTTSFRNLPMGTNTSTSQLQKRQSPIVHCGDKVGLRHARHPGGQIRTCTLGFAVKRVRGSHNARFSHGYLTLGDCVSSRLVKGGGGNSHNVIFGPQNLVIGDARNSRGNLEYDPAKGLDYAIIRITEPQVWDNGLSVGIASNDPNQPSVIATLRPVIPAKGDEICYSSVYYGLVCGELVNTDGLITRVNPWSIIRQTEYFFHAGTVGLKTIPFINGGRQEDYGAPVFVPVYHPCQEPKQIVAARPVGLLLKYDSMPFVIPEFHGIEPWVRGFTASFSYQPLGKILANEPSLTLLIVLQNLADNLVRCD